MKCFISISSTTSFATVVIYFIYMFMKLQNIADALLQLRYVTTPRRWPETSDNSEASVHCHFLCVQVQLIQWRLQFQSSLLHGSLTPSLTNSEVWWCWPQETSCRSRHRSLALPGIVYPYCLEHLLRSSWQPSKITVLPMSVHCK